MHTAEHDANAEVDPSWKMSYLQMQSRNSEDSSFMEISSFWTSSTLPLLQCAYIQTDGVVL